MNPNIDTSSTLPRRSVLSILGGFLWFASMLPVAGAADAPRMTVRQEGNVLIVQGSLQPEVDPETAWAVLTDYERHDDFIPGVRLSRVLSSQERHKLVEQQGEIMAGSLRVPYGGTMRIDESPMEGVSIVFVSGLFKDVRGEWLLGRKSPAKLSYEMRMDLLKTPYPPGMANLLAEQQVRQWVTVFAAEMERRQRMSRSK